MTRDDVTALLRQRWNLTDQRFGDDTVDAWLTLLVDASRIEAGQALIRLVQQGHATVRLADVCAQLTARRRVTQAPAPTRRCDACDSCGWVVYEVEVVDDVQHERYGPCHVCNAHHALHRPVVGAL